METKTTTATTTTEFVGAKKFKMAKSKEYKEKVQTTKTTLDIAGGCLKELPLLLKNSPTTRPEQNGAKNSGMMPLFCGSRFSPFS